MVNAKSRAACAGALLAGLLCSARPVTAQDGSDEDWFQDIEVEQERLRGEALANAMPRPRIAEDLPLVRFVPGFQVRLPYQTIGIGTPIEVVPVGWLRIGLAYAFGISTSKTTTAWGNYGEGFLGIRLFGTSSESAVDIPLRDRKPMSFRDPPAIKAWVPAHHRVFIEAGLITAFSSLRYCGTDDDCEARFGTPTPPTVDRQLVIPAGGFRYVHYYAIRSEWNKLGRRRMVQVYVHALLKPINAGDPGLHSVWGYAGGQPVGGRVGVEAHSDSCPAESLFGIGCATGNLALGFAPYPESLLFEFHVGFPVYP